jgi:hypothetical protein
MDHQVMLAADHEALTTMSKGKLMRNGVNNPVITAMGRQAEAYKGGCSGDIWRG